jgi:hypothetical protein
MTVPQSQSSVSGGRGGTGAAKLEGEVGDDAEIEDEENNFGDGNVAMELPKFEGNEGSGENNGEILGPALAEGQAHPFRESEPGVKEGADTEDFEVLVVENGDASENVMNENVAGINAHEVGPAREVCSDVFVKEIEGADSNGEKECGLREFKGGDEEKTARPGGVRSHLHHFTPS